MAMVAIDFASAFSVAPMGLQVFLDKTISPRRRRHCARTHTHTTHNNSSNNNNNNNTSTAHYIAVAQECCCRPILPAGMLIVNPDAGKGPHARCH
jgi:hypothetical protein